MASPGPADTGMFLGGSSGGDMTGSTRRTAGTDAAREDTVYRALLCIPTTALQGPGYQVLDPFFSIPPPYIRAHQIGSLLSQTWGFWLWSVPTILLSKDLLGSVVPEKHRDTCRIAGCGQINRQVSKTA